MAKDLETEDMKWLRRAERKQQAVESEAQRPAAWERNRKSWRQAAVVMEAILLMVILQFVREASERLLHPLFPGTAFAQRMSTMLVMIVLSGVVVLYAWFRKTALSVFPKHFGKSDILAGCVSAVLLITTPSNFTGGYQAIMLLLYGSIVTPVFEELVFRGYLWNRLYAVLSKEISVFIWSVALFTVWHMGYMIPQIASGNITAVVWKLAAGLGYGTVLGLLRLKTKNCYATMLLHGVLNIFMV